MPEPLTQPVTSEGREVREDHPPRPRWLWAVIVIVLLAVAAFFVFRHRPHAQAGGAKAGMAQRGGMGQGQGPLMVSTATAQKGDIGVYVSALGLVTPVNTVAVRSRVDGQLVEVHYKEG